VRGFGRVNLPEGPGDSTPPSRPIDGQDGPPLAILVAEVNEQCVPVVLDAQAVVGVALLVESARFLFVAVRQERRPARTGRARRSGPVPGSEHLDPIAVRVGDLEADEAVIILPFGLRHAGLEQPLAGTANLVGGWA